jgi:hypothetical protein
VRIAVAVFELRHPQDHAEVYASDIDDRATAFLRAQELADFYRHPVEVCQRIGRVRRRIGEAQPSPPAPTHN